MLRRNRNIEELNKKCELLEDLGFTINHRDSDVSFETINTHFEEFDTHFEEFDFSATAPDVQAIIYTALHHVYKLGVKQGREMNQRALRQALGMDE